MPPSTRASGSRLRTSLSGLIATGGAALSSRRNLSWLSSSKRGSPAPHRASTLPRRPNLPTALSNSGASSCSRQRPSRPWPRAIKGSPCKPNQLGSSRKLLSLSSNSGSNWPSARRREVPERTNRRSMIKPCQGVLRHDSLAAASPRRSPQPHGLDCSCRVVPPQRNRT